MNSKKTSIILLFFCCTLIFIPVSSAQNKISSSVFGNGGTPVSGSNNVIVSTVGQTAIGVTSNSNNTNQVGFWYQTTDLVTSVESIETDLLPTEFRLEQNYPNPFNPATTIRFAVPKTSNVTIKIFDILGREVTTLVDDKYQPGEYKVIFEAGDLGSGLYIYRILADGFSESRKLMLLK